MQIGLKSGINKVAFTSQKTINIIIKVTLISLC